MRFAMVAVSGAAISVVTVSPSAGRLHLLRHPAPDRAGQPARPSVPAAAGLADPCRGGRGDRRAPLLRSDAFDHPALWWVGLSAINPRSNDYVPLFPWFGAVLVGIAAALARPPGCWRGWRRSTPGRWAKPLIFLGRHSLAFYLIHQPVLIGCVWLFAQIVPAPVETPRSGLPEGLPGSCEQQRDTEFCAAIVCACWTRSKGEAAFDRLTMATDPGVQSASRRLAGICTAKTTRAR